MNFLFIILLFTNMSGNFFDEDFILCNITEYEDLCEYDSSFKLTPLPRVIRLLYIIYPIDEYDFVESMFCE